MIIKEEGKKTRYYYYKKKSGRHKKPGPKPKKIKKIRKTNKWDYKIVVTSHKKQIDYINKYVSLEAAIKAFKLLKEKNNEIIFPVKYINAKILKEAHYEYLLLKRNNDGILNSKLRNKYGKLTDNIIVNDENWIIYDKAEKLVEETFWIYGFHPLLQRKTFLWILENIVINNIKNTYDILRIVLFKNKIIIKQDNNDIDIIICKNISDAIRMYNLLEEYSNNLKIKQIFFIGSANIIGEFRKNIINDIYNKTRWSIKKITRSTTRP